MSYLTMKKRFNYTSSFNISCTNCYQKCKTIIYYIKMDRLNNDAILDSNK